MQQRLIKQQTLLRTISSTFLACTLASSIILTPQLFIIASANNTTTNTTETKQTNSKIPVKPLAQLPHRNVKGITEVTLPTGQMLYIQEDHSMPIVTIDTWVSTGSVNETAENNGVSHFLEHLLFKGTERFKQGDIDRLIESKGSTFNAATSDDFTHYYITTSSEFFKESLDIHADMLLNSLIPEDELKLERKVVQEEINRANDKPFRNLFITVAEAIYKNHGYALDTLGPKSNIANIPRQSIMDYYHYWYQPKHLKTVIVGDVNPNEVVMLMQQHFSHSVSPLSTDSSYTPPSPTTIKTLPQQQITIIEDPNVSQCYIGIAFLAPSIDQRKEAAALDVAIQAIGSGKSSPLYKTMKQDLHLVSSVSAGNWTQKYGGLAYVLAETPPEKLEEAQATLFKTLNSLKKTGINSDDLEKTKTQTIKDFIFLNETTDGIASSVGYNIAIGTLEDYTDYVDWIQAISKEQADSSLKTYLDMSHAVVVQVVPKGHYASIDDAKKQISLHLNPPLQTQVEGIIADSEQNGDALRKQAKELLADIIENGSINTKTVGSETATSYKAPKPDIEKDVLNNGITLITKQRKNSDTVAIKVFVKGGKSVEKVPGTATLLSALLKKGTLARTVEDINTELESRGMSLSVSAGNDYILVSGHCISDDFGELFLILQDVLSQPIFDETEFAKAKEDLKNSIKASHDEPASIALENATTNLYPWHPYGNVGSRVEKHLDLLTQDTIAEYFDTYFIPEQMVVSVVGDVDSNTVKSYLEAALPNVINERSNLNGETLSWPDVPPLQTEKTIEFSKAKQSATWIAQSWLGPDADSKDYAAFKVLNSLLGTGMSSRLFAHLREKQGLAYSIASALPTTKEDMRFTLYAGTAPQNEAKILEGFKQEIDTLKTKLVDEQELKEAKDKLSGAFALAHETNANQAFYLGFYETLGMNGKGYTFDAAYHNWIQSITPEDIQRVAQKYLSQPAILSIVAPEKKPVEIAPSPSKKEPKPTTEATKTN